MTCARYRNTLFRMQDNFTIADFRNAFFEYRTVFEEPIFRFWNGERQVEMVAALHKALSPWGIGLEGMSWNQSAKNLGEIQLTIGVPSLSATIQVGVGGVTMSANNPDWSHATQYATLFQTALDTLKAKIEQEFQAQQATLAFHLAPGAKPFRDLLMNFVKTADFASEDAKMFGVSAYYSDFSFVIDASLLVPDGVFVKLNRIFPSRLRFEHMADALFRDEQNVLARLGSKLQ